MLGVTLGERIVGWYIFMINLHKEIYFLFFTENDKNFMGQTDLIAFAWWFVVAKSC